MLHQRHLTYNRALLRTIIDRKTSERDLVMKTETLNLNPSRGATTAYVARPENDTTAAVMLIQEWWGINDHIRDIAGRYANEGYLCVAPDLYRGKLAKDSDEAAKMMQELAIEDGMETIRAAIAEAKRAYNVQKIGITGYCMGGTFALRAACEISELAAAAPFYGDIPEEDVSEKVESADAVHRRQARRLDQS